MIDAHAHLADPVFDADRQAVLDRAAEAGVTRIVVVGETPGEAARILELASQFPQLSPAIGLYPAHLDQADLEAALRLISAHAGRLAAVGEIGLDHWAVQDPGERQRQREFFLAQVRLAIELDLPVNVHSRSAGAATIEALVEAGARRVLLHAFDGRPGTARAGLEAGYFFSIPPSIVRSRQKQKLARFLPTDRLLLESDSPVLGPEPGMRNEPCRIDLACRALAEIKGLSPEEIKEGTTANARRLFRFR